MTPVARQEIVDYQTYEEHRPELRRAVMAEKEVRRIHVGEHLTFLFETHDTVRYQIQEMMRVERLVKEAEIVHEIETYNELLGGPGELGCTLLIEIDDVEQRDVLLRQWLGLPEHLYVKLGDGRRIRAKHDPRQVGEERLSSVQYLKFDTQGQVPVAIGSDLPALTSETPLTDPQRQALAKDLGGQV
jgi:hypothetical protein